MKLKLKAYDYALKSICLASS